MRSGEAAQLACQTVKLYNGRHNLSLIPIIAGENRSEAADVGALGLSLNSGNFLSFPLFRRAPPDSQTAVNSRVRGQTLSS